MVELLLFVSIVLLLCSVLEKLSFKIGIPALLLFIILGMLMGSDGLFKISFEDYAFARDISTIALIFIMSTGGFDTNLKACKRIITKSLVYSSLGTILTAILVGLFCHLIIKMPLLEGLLCGSVLASTDAASVFSILRSKKLALKEKTAPLLEIESGSNDPFAYMLTAVLLNAFISDISFNNVIILLSKQIIVGILFGLIIAYVSKYIMKSNLLDTSGVETIFILANIILGYALSSYLGGNGFLSVYIIGIILGNAQLLENKVLVPFFDGITKIMQAVLFFLLGLLSFPSSMLEVLGISIIIAIALVVIRFIVIYLLSIPFKSSFKQILLVSFSGLKGAASIVFAIEIILSPIVIHYDIFHIVFIVVLLSISIQGTLLPMVAKKLDMIDLNGDILRTFTDYIDEKPVNYIEFKIDNNHKWCNMMIKDIILPPNSLIVSLSRNNLRIVPNGKTILMENDEIIMCTLKNNEVNDFYLKEKTITEEDLINGNKISNISKDGALIVLIQRNNEYIVPDGNTEMEINDHILLNYKKYNKYDKI